MIAMTGRVLVVCLAVSGPGCQRVTEFFNIRDTEIEVAVKAHDVEAVRRLLGAADAPDAAAIARGARRYIRPVEIAARQWSAEGVRLLLAHGLDVKTVDVSNALTAAAANGCAPVITLLLDAGADVNARDMQDDTPLAMARRSGNDEISALLVSRGARDP